MIKVILNADLHSFFALTTLRTLTSRYLQVYFLRKKRQKKVVTQTESLSNNRTAIGTERQSGAIAFLLTIVF